MFSPRYNMMRNQVKYKGKYRWQPPPDRSPSPRAVPSSIQAGTSWKDEALLTQSKQRGIASLASFGNPKGKALGLGHPTRSLNNAKKLEISLRCLMNSV